MDNLIFAPSALLGIASAIWYVHKCIRARRQIQVSTLITIILQAAGVVAGSVLALSTLIPALYDRLQGMKLYVLIGGIAVSVVSFQALHRDLVTEESLPPSSERDADREGRDS